MLFAPLLGAAFSPLLVRALGHNAAWILALSLFVPFLVFAGHIDTVAAGGIITGGFTWAPTFGADFLWKLDGLSLTFALLISGIGTLIVLYSGAYLKGHPGQGRFIAFILMFSFSMLGVVISDNLLMLFIYWELTSITSFLLIGFDHEREAARRGAYQALLVTGGGGLCLLAGLLMLGQLTGANSISGLIAGGAAIRDHYLAEAALVLVLLGAFTKSAQFPFHFWLPNAMEAPTPVSAFLHSATMVKAGVYLLMRLYPVFGEMDLWQTALPLFGGVTLLVGGFLALRQTDLKLMLAYTTVASLGLLVMLTGIGHEKAIEAAVLYLFAHALFKGALFMIAGVIDHEAGSRDITKLGGLGRAMPITFAAALIAACSMGGIPFFAGFMAKEEIYAALTTGNLAMIAAIAGNAMMFAIGFAIALKVFLGPAVETPKHAHDGPVLLMAGPVLLAIMGLAVALVPTELHQFISSPMASAVLGASAHVEITAIPHISLPFLLSLLTIVLGAVILLFLDRVRAAASRLLDIIGWGPDRGFDQFVSGTVRGAWHLTRFLQPGRLEIYLTVVFIVIALSLLWPLFAFGELPAWPSWPALQIHEAAFMLIAVIGLVAVLIARSRITAIVALGIQGFAVAVLYLLFGAPDLSFTQFMVETLSVVILALIMTRLRLDVTDRRPLGHVLFDGAIAIACGLGFALFLLRAVEIPFNTELTEFFSQYSKIVAHGANVVNVIIVDFRGTDTLGEIAVVTITGLAILALIRLRTAPVTRTFNDPDLEERERI
ncbi:putative monovalent cation/H+ antiporter subunit A [Rhizobium sp. TH2]|uniref:putative monovalent cation/H+ antiporter subunit A n=1 Tax=Rhizobium sp. TH2 TaxID=2775403 RepID=UPI002158388A|nr:putative monovalent cation/H+ antiporter subunit A [Rhizobium sp. TH2]UVC10259.1 putative monovalent cation/H+ antiporter subunit A [Rhizobium sp. TH2]